MTQIIVEKMISAPTADVWAMVTDLVGSVEVLTSVVGLEITAKGEKFGVGTAWTESRVMNGRESSEDFSVVELDEGASYTTESHSGPVFKRSIAGAIQADLDDFARALNT